MVRFPDVVRAPPDRVWAALLEPRTRLLDARVAAETEARPPGHEFRRKGHAWVENILESTPPGRLVLERREGDAATARLVWELQPIDLGTHVVLDVKGTTIGQVLRHRYALRWHHRRTVATLKKACEAPPPSRVQTNEPAPATPLAPEAAAAWAPPTPTDAAPATAASSEAPAPARSSTKAASRRRKK